jgi:hypothetical protein
MSGEHFSPETSYTSPENRVADAHRRAATEFAGASPEEIFDAQDAKLFVDFLAYVNTDKGAAYVKDFRHSTEFEFPTGYEGRGYVLGKYGNSEKVESGDKILVICEDGRLRSTDISAIRSTRSIYTERQKGILPPKLRPRALGSLALRGIRAKDTQDDAPFHPGIITEKDHRVVFKHGDIQDVLERAAGRNFAPLDLSNLPPPEEPESSDEYEESSGEEMDPRRREQELRARELRVRERVVELQEQQLDKGIIPGMPAETRASAPRNSEKDQSYTKALRRYEDNLKLIDRYETDPNYNGMFEAARLKALHDEIQSEAWPLYEARLAELNDGKADDEKIASVEKMPADERRKIVDPIDQAHTQAYIAANGHDSSDELKRALTLARLKAVGKLQKPRKPQA